jgi:hypothetical protein
VTHAESERLSRPKKEIDRIATASPYPLDPPDIKGKPRTRETRSRLVFYGSSRLAARKAI